MLIYVTTATCFLLPAQFPTGSSYLSSVNGASEENSAKIRPSVKPNFASFCVKAGPVQRVSLLYTACLLQIGR